MSSNLQSEFTNVRILMNRYDSVPVLLADACLVRMSEKMSSSIILTLDSDFIIYRKYTQDLRRLNMEISY